MKRLLPIGIQDFAGIREGGFLYVDKTAQIHKLVTGSGGVFFLSRPRRFGKSLLCSTLRTLFLRTEGTLPRHCRTAGSGH
jgi:hypothetical protein